MGPRLPAERQARLERALQFCTGGQQVVAVRRGDLRALMALAEGAVLASALAAALGDALDKTETLRWERDQARRQHRRTLIRAMQRRDELRALKARFARALAALGAGA